MASHGIPRTATKLDRSAEARQKELKEIQIYQQLVEEVNTKVEAGEYTPSVLEKTAELLKRNPEYYTVWNHRRRIYANEFNDLNNRAASGEIEDDIRISQILDIIQLDLQFLFPLLLKFPKCYWIWNHRLWLLEQSTELLPPSTARQVWQDELGLVSKMLSRDGRNFHGWGYRRRVIESLESSRLDGRSMARSEFDYTTKMITSNLSNFSAWHNRMKLILRFFEEEKAGDKERQNTLDEELKLIHKALFDPYDQSLWFYHQSLMCTFNPKVSDKTIAPNLTKDQRQEYLSTEREFIEDLLEDARDCKWVYQALIEITLLQSELAGKASEMDNRNIADWLQNLKKLDPLRSGRWSDLEKSCFSS